MVNKITVIYGAHNFQVDRMGVRILDLFYCVEL